jgi:hypothetical protein
VDLGHVDQVLLLAQVCIHDSFVVRYHCIAREGTECKTGQISTILLHVIQIYIFFLHFITFFNSSCQVWLRLRMMLTEV